MHVIPVQTSLLCTGDSLSAFLKNAADIRDGDILVISSKAIATVEGAAIHLLDVVVSKEAEILAEKNVKSATFYQVVLNETERMHGKIVQSVHGIVLTELHPDPSQEGSLFVPNAGLDRSNIADGFVIGWPKDPVKSALKIREEMHLDIGIIVTDSGLVPRRRGVTAFALCNCGFDPIVSMIGSPDLFGQDMSVTEEAVADQLATAANFVMGNTNQCTPAAIIRDHHIPFTNFCGWVPGIERQKDLYHGVI